MNDSRCVPFADVSKHLVAVQQYRLKNYNFTLQALTRSGPDIAVITELKKYNYLQQLL